MRALLLVTLVGCQSSPAEATPVGVELRDRAGAVVVRVERTRGGCTIDPPALTATVAGTETTAGSWRIVPGPTGRELHGAAGLLARVVDESGRLSVIDPVGVPLARFVRTDDRGAGILDAGRTPIGRLEAEATGFRVLDRDARPGAAVDGTTDLPLAAVLAAVPTLPVEVRALFACERLTSAPVPAK